MRTAASRDKELVGFRPGGAGRARVVFSLDDWHLTARDDSGDTARPDDVPSNHGLLPARRYGVECDDVKGPAQGVRSALGREIRHVGSLAHDRCYLPPSAVRLSCRAKVVQDLAFEAGTIDPC